MRVFYAWQSDCPEKTNRYFIKNALENAIKEINKTFSVEEAKRGLELDHDTKNIPGTPDIASVIFNKIRDSDVFVVDLSMPFSTSNGKLSPNPNVLLEYGYALGTIGSSRIIGVMNTFYGSGDALPFDIRHRRHPIAYQLQEEELSETETKRSITQKLQEQLRDALKAVCIDVAAMNSLKTSDNSAPTGLDALKNKILASDPFDDWIKESGNWDTTAIYRHDVNLRISISYDEDGIQQRNFVEEWANCNLDRNATGYWCDVFYGNSRITREILVSVDGGRSTLPIPKKFDSDGKEKIVMPFDYKLAQIFDSLGNLDEYLYRSGLKIEAT